MGDPILPPKRGGYRAERDLLRLQSGRVAPGSGGGSKPGIFVRCPTCGASDVALSRQDVRQTLGERLDERLADLNEDTLSPAVGGFDPDALTVCIEHGAFIPCRKAGEHFYSQSPIWVGRVRAYHEGAHGLAWEPASERALRAIRKVDPPCEGV